MALQDYGVVLRVSQEAGAPGKGHCERSWASKDAGKFSWHTVTSGPWSAAERMPGYHDMSCLGLPSSGPQADDHSVFRVSHLLHHGLEDKAGPTVLL